MISWRYIEDIFIAWMHGEEYLKKGFEKLNIFDSKEIPLQKRYQEFEIKN